MSAAILTVMMLITKIFYINDYDKPSVWMALFSTASRHLWAWGFVVILIGLAQTPDCKLLGSMRTIRRLTFLSLHSSHAEEILRASGLQFAGEAIVLYIPRASVCSESSADEFEACGDFGLGGNCEFEINFNESFSSFPLTFHSSPCS